MATFISKENLTSFANSLWAKAKALIPTLAPVRGLKVNNSAQAPDANGIVNITVPTKTSSITNDSGFITKTVNDLTNYYTKTNTYNKDEVYTKVEVNGRLDLLPTLTISVVQSLPTSNISTKTLYLVRNSGSESGNLFSEYIYINNAWEKLGEQTLDLTPYLTKTEASSIYPTSTEVGATYLSKTAAAQQYALKNGSLGEIFKAATFETEVITLGMGDNLHMSGSSDELFLSASSNITRIPLSGGDKTVATTDQIANLANENGSFENEFSASAFTFGNDHAGQGATASMFIDDTSSESAPIWFQFFYERGNNGMVTLPNPEGTNQTIAFSSDIPTEATNAEVTAIVNSLT